MTTLHSETRRKSYQVIASMSGGWAVRRYGSRRAEKRFRTRDEALEWGVRRSREKNADLYVFRSDGTIEEYRAAAPGKGA
jgi:hypothetical protein